MTETTRRFIIRQRVGMIDAYRAGVPVVEIARRFAVHRKTVHKWLRRYREGGKAALLDQSRRPRGHPRTLEPTLVQLVGRRRQETHYGPVRLQWLLVERQGLYLSRGASTAPCRGRG